MTHEYINIISNNKFLHLGIYILFFMFPLWYLLGCCISVLYFLEVKTIFLFIGYFIITYIQEQLLFIKSHLSLHINLYE